MKGEREKSAAILAAGDGRRGQDVSAVASAKADARAPLPFLNPFEDIHTHRHHLPHWQQGEAWQFVTWRLADSMSRSKLDEWQAERVAWLRDHPEPWDGTTEEDYHARFSRRVDEWLDAGHGSCVLRRKECAEIVANALRHFDVVRYALGPFVVMPNHVHVLFQPKPPHALEKIVHSWKSYTANEINRFVSRTGPLWQEDYWDRMLRHEVHWLACRHYIRENPSRLPAGSFVLFDGERSERSAGILPATLITRGQDARAPLG